MTIWTYWCFLDVIPTFVLGWLKLIYMFVLFFLIFLEALFVNALAGTCVWFLRKVVDVARLRRKSVVDAQTIYIAKDDKGP